MKDLIKKVLKEEFDWVIEPSEAEKFIYNKFKECKLVPAKERFSDKNSGWTKYIDKNGKMLFVDNIDLGTDSKIYFSYDHIFKKLYNMGLEYEEMKKLITDILLETKNRKVDEAYALYDELMELQHP